VVSVLFLIGLFANISMYLIILGLTFIGLSYLIVYIGAVSILFLFILMLINIRISELQNNNSNSIPLSIVLGILFYYPIYNLLPYDITKISFNYLSPYFINTDNKLYFVSSKIWDGNLGENNHMAAIGNIMYTNYNLWLIIASFILLLAMVGAIVITIKPK
jgi:NADH-ubiquinone oxidoreductase chain 6